MRNFSTEQLNYFAAKANYETIQEQIKIEVEKSGANQMVTDGKRTPENKAIIDKRYEIINSIEFKLGKWEALDQLLKAEDELLKWSHEQVKTANKYNSQKDDMEELFANCKKFPKIKEKMIDAACKLILSQKAV